MISHLSRLRALDRLKSGSHDIQCPDKELRSQGYRPESPAFLAV